MSIQTPVETNPHDQEASYKKQLSMFFIGLEILGEKKKERFLLYLLSLKKPDRENEEKKTDELQNSAA